MTVETSWPYGNATGISSVVSQAQWERAFGHNILDGGVLAEPGSASLRPFSQAVGNRQVTVNEGPAAIYGHTYEAAGDVNFNLAENVSGQIRYDRIVIRLDPSLPYDPENGINERCRLTVIQGAPGSGIPQVSRDRGGIYDVRIGIFPVPSGALTIDPTTVIDDREYARTGVIPCRTVDDLTVRRRIGDIAWETSTNLLKGWSGSAWLTINPANPANNIETLAGSPYPSSFAVTVPRQLVQQVAIPARPYRRLLTAEASALILAGSSAMSFGFRLYKTSNPVSGTVPFVDRTRLARASIGATGFLSQDFALDADQVYTLQSVGASEGGSVTVTVDHRFTYLTANLRGRA